jgi:all-trans-8'-apo-beta-carotenal 15,15'-oxygenase
MHRRQFLQGSAVIGASALLPAFLSNPAFAEEDAYYTGFRKGLKKHPWLAGYAGVAEDLNAGPITFEGKLPKALRGTLFRNGPGLIERGGQRYQHLFDGDGMVQAYAIGDNGLTHRGRFVRTRKFVTEAEQGKFLFPGFGTSAKVKFPISGPDSVNAANTSVIAHGNRLMALWEGGSAYEMDLATLETKGPIAWNKEFKGVPFSAHPKVEPNGTMWNFGAFANSIAIYQIAPDGKLVKAEVIKVPGVPMNHDFVVSQNHLIFVLPAIKLNLDKVREGHSFLDSMDFDRKAPMRVLTVEKADFSKQRFYELPAGFLFHYGNAWEDKDGTIRFDYVRHEAGAEFMTGSMRALMRGDVEAMTPAHSASSHVVIDTKRGTIREETHKHNVEFPRVDPRVVAGRYRHLYHTATLRNSENTFEMNAVLRYDLESGKEDACMLGNEYAMEEHIVVPRPGSTKEGDGWLVGPAFNAKTGKTEVLVFDALKLADGPLAVAKLPYGVPLGFHGNFLQA